MEHYRWSDSDSASDSSFSRIYKSLDLPKDTNGVNSSAESHADILEDISFNDISESTSLDHISESISLSEEGQQTNQIKTPETKLSELPAVKGLLNASTVVGATIVVPIAAAGLIAGGVLANSAALVGVVAGAAILAAGVTLAAVSGIVVSPFLGVGFLAYLGTTKILQTISEKAKDKNYAEDSQIKNYCKDQACKVGSQIKNFFTQRIKEAFPTSVGVDLALKLKEELLQDASYFKEQGSLESMISESDLKFLEIVESKNNLTSNEINHISNIHNKVSKRIEVNTALKNILVSGDNGRFTLIGLDIPQKSKDKLQKFIDKIYSTETPPKPLSLEETKEALEILKTIENEKVLEEGTRKDLAGSKFEEILDILTNNEKQNSLISFSDAQYIGTVNHEDLNDLEINKIFNIHSKVTIRNELFDKLEILGNSINRKEVHDKLEVRGIGTFVFPPSLKLPEESKMRFEELFNKMSENDTPAEPLSLSEAKEALAILNKIIQKEEIKTKLKEIGQFFTQAYGTMESEVKEKGIFEFTSFVSGWTQKNDYRFLYEEEVNNINDLYDYYQGTCKLNGDYSDGAQMYAEAKDHPEYFIDDYNFKIQNSLYLNDKERAIIRDRVEEARYHEEI